MSESFGTSVRASPLWTHHLRSSICRRFGPLFLGRDEREIRAFVFYTIRVRALELVRASSLYVLKYTDAARDSVIVYCSMVGAQSGVVLSSLLPG